MINKMCQLIIKLHIRPPNKAKNHHCRIQETFHNNIDIKIPNLIEIHQKGVQFHDQA